MKSSKMVIPLILCFAVVSLTGCARRSDEVWEDTKTAGRYMGRGLRSIGGKSGDSRQVTSRDQFGVASNYRDDFVPLYDEEKESALSLGEPEAIPQSKTTPGDPGSPVPGIDAFVDPDHDPELAAIFRKVHFPYNSELIKGSENLQTARAIASYLKKHPKAYIFVEGHCDERGPQAYNLALGMRRSNAVRTFLVNEGVPLDNVFTISYGKERPIKMGSDEVSWSENRRAQFKVYRR